jgi:PAS domain S-box-containing protein
VEVEMEKTANEVTRLQSCINDLISVLALAAIWSGSESRQMLGTLLDSLLAILRLDFACARLNYSIDGSPIEVVRLAQRRHPSAQPQEVGRALARWLSGDETGSRFVIQNPVGEGEVAIASFPLGLQDEVGVLVAGSRRADFPTDIELLLLRVAANQAAIGLQEARRSGEQKGVAEALERRVAERTTQLTAVNEELRRSQAYLAEAQRVSHTGSFGWRPATGEIFFSEETFRIFQYDPATKPTVKLALQRVHPDDAALVKQTIERASQDGKDFEHEYRLVMPDRSVKYVHVMAHPSKDESGSVEFVGAVMDVTVAKQAEARIRQIIDTIPAYAWSIEPDGSVDFINQRFLEFTGRSIEELLGWGWASTHHPDDVPREIAVWRAALAAGEPMESEVRMRGRDGDYRWLLIRNVPLRDAMGNIVKWYGTAFEIEDRKRAEEQLRKTETELRQLIDVIPQQVFVFDSNWNPLFANRREREYTGLTLQEMQSKDAVAKIFHPEDLKKLEVIRERGRSEGAPFELEARIRGNDGQYRWFLIRDNPLRDVEGHVLRWYGTRTDIEDRKLAEMLLAGEKRLLEMIARGDSRVLILDALSRLVEELVRGSLSSILLLDPNVNRLRHGAAPSLPITYTEAIDGLVIGPSVGSCGTAAYRAEPVIVSDIATDLLWADFRGLALAHGLRACWSSPILSSEGRVLGIFATYYREPRSPTPQEQNVIERITHLASIAVERERAEEALHQAQADLTHVSRVTTMGELTASLAHEVNQPIAAAVTNAKTCLRWLTRDHPDVEEACAAAMRIVNDGTRAGEIVGRIRLLFEKGTSQRELVDVNEVIREMIVLLRGETTRYNILVGTDLAADLPQVTGDRVQLQQVLMNLMINGMDAMKDMDGTRELAIKSQRAENEQLLVSVSDTGMGLPRQADQIFNAFFTTKPHGTGMGLRISRSIVESHGGRLWAAENLPRGASFCFTLPTKAEAHE